MKVLDHGEIKLIDSCAEDLDVVNAARVSFHETSSEMDERNRGLIKYLMRERHGTPFEQGYFKFYVKAPLFVLREWQRHRVGHSYNEWSARYSELEPEFYIPSEEKMVKQVGKPGHYKFETLEDKADVAELRKLLKYNNALAYSNYQYALRKGLAKQQARLFLPVNIYSAMIWSCNPRSLMHFLSLRNSLQAQEEIRDYAQAAERYFAATMPVTAEAFIENNRLAP